jgi:large subunit ribosomal protein L6
MSKIGKKPIKIPQEVKIEESDGILKIKGPKGETSFSYPKDVFNLVFENGEIKIFPKAEELDKKTKALWGTLRALLQNKIIGVAQGFIKTLILQGLGYSAEVKGKEIFFKLGFSHPVVVEIPQSLEVEVKGEKGRFLIYIKGIEKEEVGNFASKIKALKPADRYHLKGFMYEGEFIPTKPVKKLGK